MTDLTALAATLECHELPFNLVNLLVRAVLKIDESVARRVHAAKQLVEFEMESASVAVLGVLHQEYHQEGDDGCAGINDELPGI